jgi:predicted type IV restriction endonuclease
MRAILRTKVNVNRINPRDGQTYFSVLLDDNNRKPICRLYLNGKKNQIDLFDGEVEARNEITSLDDIYLLSDRIAGTVDKYEKEQDGSSNIIGECISLLLGLRPVHCRACSILLAVQASQQ